jgi:Ca2+-binding EF-hand superfamily protein
VDQAFSLLKSRFKEADTNKDDKITEAQFRKILQGLSPNNTLEEQTFKTVIQSIQTTNGISFKQYLYGMYLFIQNIK